MTNSIEVIQSKERKDYAKLIINGVDMGEWEKSQRRHLIEVIDKSI